MRLAAEQLPETVSLSTREGIELIEVENRFAKATITTFGACVLSYVPQGQQDLLWVSEQAIYDGTKPVRGGIPVCWPWFGKATTEGYPAHGLVRSQVWQLESAEQLENGITQVCLKIEQTELSKTYFKPDFDLRLIIEVGQTLRLTLSTDLQGSDITDITEALHTYFNVANPQTLTISGLDGSTHLDKLNEARLPEQQHGAVELKPARDSVYQNQPNDMIIHDSDNQRNIHIKTSNANSAVIWNPGPEIVKGFADISNQGWKEFACVESGNVLADAVKVTPQQNHSFSVEYWIENCSN